MKKMERTLRTASRCRNIVYTLHKFGIKISFKEVVNALKERNSSLLKIWENNKDITHLNQLSLLIKYTLKNFTVPRKEWMDELSKAFVSPFFENPPSLNPDAHRVLRWLKDKNKLIGIICNIGHTLVLP